jgi:hypothetical protein
MLRMAAERIAYLEIEFHCDFSKLKFFTLKKMLPQQIL